MNKRLKAFQERRLKAAEMFEQGVGQAEAARRLGVTRQSAHDWFHTWESGGEKALRGPGRTGPKPRLDERQLKRLEKELLKGPLAHGYDTQLWTLPRMARVIERTFGVRYHPAHVWRVLQRIGWTWQVPQVKAKERDEAAIDQWVKETWPKIKKARGGGEKP